MKKDFNKLHFLISPSGYNKLATYWRDLDTLNKWLYWNSIFLKFNTKDRTIIQFHLLHEIWLVHLASSTFFISYERQSAFIPATWRPTDDVTIRLTVVSLCCYGDIDPQNVQIIDFVEIISQIMSKTIY
jgi:hypothetical protein